jgi:hypothetical protein
MAIVFLSFSPVMGSCPLLVNDTLPAAGFGNHHS